MFLSFASSLELCDYGRVDGRSKFRRSSSQNSVLAAVMTFKTLLESYPEKSKCEGLGKRDVIVIPLY